MAVIKPDTLTPKPALLCVTDPEGPADVQVKLPVMRECLLSLVVPPRARGVVHVAAAVSETIPLVLLPPVRGCACRMQH